MKNQIKRLRLNEGDIVVCRDDETMRRLATMGPIKGVPACPIILSEGSIHRLSKEYLRKLLAE